MNSVICRWQQRRVKKKSGTAAAAIQVCFYVRSGTAASGTAASILS
jgi:hypothetical protein